jgi:predicted RNA-binding protein YlqC (UPF0109 family)
MQKSAIVPELKLAATIARTVSLMTETVKLLVEYPDRVTIEAKTTAEQVNILVHVAPEDIGKVLGKQGRIANSLRMLLHSIGQKSGIRIQFDVLGDNS